MRRKLGEAPGRKKVLAQCYFDPLPINALRALSDETRIPVAAYIREAVDDLLKKYHREPRETDHGEPEGSERRGDEGQREGGA